MAASHANPNPSTYPRHGTSLHADPKARSGCGQSRASVTLPMSRGYTQHTINHTIAGSCLRRKLRPLTCGAYWLHVLSGSKKAARFNQGHSSGLSASRSVGRLLCDVSLHHVVESQQTTAVGLTLAGWSLSASSCPRFVRAGHHEHSGWAMRQEDEEVPHHAVRAGC